MRSPKLEFVRVWQGIGWVMVLVVVVETLAPDPVSGGLGIWDKALHCAAYAGLMWWFRQSFALQAVWLPFLLLLGGFLELAQPWLGDRSFDGTDLLANGAGVLSGLLLAWTALGRTVSTLDRKLTRFLR